MCFTSLMGGLDLPPAMELDVGLPEVLVPLRAGLGSSSFKHSCRGASARS